MAATDIHGGLRNDGCVRLRRPHKITTNDERANVFGDTSRAIFVKLSVSRRNHLGGGRITGTFTTVTVRRFSTKTETNFL